MIGPLHDPVTWNKMAHAGTQLSYTLKLPGQSNSHRSTLTCLCFGSSTVQLASKVGVIISRDRIVQRAYYFYIDYYL